MKRSFFNERRGIDQTYEKAILSQIRRLAHNQQGPRINRSNGQVDQHWGTDQQGS